MTNMNYWWWIATLLLIAAATVILLAARENSADSQVRRRFREALRQKGPQGPQSGVESRQWQQALLERFSRGEMDELPLLLRQAGWGGAEARYYFLLAAWLLPLACCLAGAAYAATQGEDLGHILLYVLFGFGLPFVGIRRLLRWKAQSRQEAIRREVVTWLHLLRMLFDAGLSVEHILHVTEEQGRDLIPNIAHELRQVLVRIRAGQERGEALAEMAGPLDVPELNDAVAMIRQVTRYGGNISESLASYAALLEQRQVSELREYVSKLSAKMSIVMMVFLFPALIIFLAGPGFMGLVRALKGLT
ncbi:MAG TPA: type II secretion system F family protein [Methylophilaceae bacterium]|jgi:tight adherence protein C